MPEERMFPHDAVIIRFSQTSPFWALSQSYGMFRCSNTKRIFHSVDHYVAFRMLARPEDRARIIRVPNGYLAHANLLDILEKSVDTLESPVIIPGWEEQRDDIMTEALEMKFTQSTMLAEELMRTGSRPLFDDSRQGELYWCYCEGEGKNMHAKIMERVRSKLLNGELLIDVPRPPRGRG